MSIGAIARKAGPFALLGGMGAFIGYQVLSGRRFKEQASKLAPLAQQRLGVWMSPTQIDRVRIAPPIRGSKTNYFSTLGDIAAGWANPRDAYEIEGAYNYLLANEAPRIAYDSGGEPYLAWPHPLASPEARVRVEVPPPSIPPEPFLVERPTPTPTQAQRVRIAMNPGRGAGDWVEVLGPGEANHAGLRAATQRGDVLSVIDALDAHMDLARKIVRNLERVPRAWYPDGSLRLPVAFHFEDGPGARLWLRWAP